MSHTSWLIRYAQRWLSFGILMLAGADASAQTNCQLATEYDALAAKARNQFQDQIALGHWQRASELCPSYTRWQALGELTMEFGDVKLDQSCTGSDENPCKIGSVAAAEAFIAALPLATTNAEAAASIGRYAQVLYFENDPQKANNYISQALELDPDSLWIQELANEIPKTMNTREALRTGLGDFNVPQMVLSSMRSLTVLSRDATVAERNTGSPVTLSPVRTGAINVPLNFIVNTTRLDQASEPQLRDVVDILSEDPDREYHIIGHADVTGSTQRNQELSEQRAEAIYLLITTMAPTLRGRVSHEGQGSRKPLRSGMTPDDHKENRRVEIFVK